MLYFCWCSFVSSEITACLYIALHEFSCSLCKMDTNYSDEHYQYKDYQTQLFCNNLMAASKDPLRRHGYTCTAAIHTVIYKYLISNIRHVTSLPFGIFIQSTGWQNCSFR